MDSLKMLTTKLQHHSLNDSMTQATDEEVSKQLDAKPRAIDISRTVILSPIRLCPRLKKASL